MTALYLANPTKQLRVVQLRIPERSSPLVQSIPPGRQIKVAGVDSTAQVEAILKSMSKYGWREASEVRNGVPFVGIIYGLDRPIKHPLIAKALDHNRSVLDRRGRQTRKLAAVATNQVIDNAIAEADSPAILQATDVQLVEEDTPSTAHDGDRISEGMSIDKSVETGPTGEVDGRRGGKNRR